MKHIVSEIKTLFIAFISKGRLRYVTSDSCSVEKLENASVLIQGTSMSLLMQMIYGTVNIYLQCYIPEALHLHWYIEYTY